ncbi:hypothetical protein LDENG_00159640 [Lucifuga dentata]|nr:hypothetical protein LDENG_00159640 [Lucifuga dentata]
MSEDISCGRGKDVTLFQKGQIIGLHQAKKTTKEIAETTKIGLRTVQCIIKTWKDVLEKTLCSGPTLPSSIQDLGEKLMQFWMEINVVTLHKLIEMMPWRMRAVNKAKGGPTKY